MPDLAASSRAWARNHGVILSVVPVRNANSPEWHCEARTERGCMALDVTTDGYEPDPFDCLFGVWAHETPGDREYHHAAEVLGPDALRELAELLGWI